MMPGLLRTTSLSGLSSKASERGAFPKPFPDRIHTDEASAAYPSGAVKAVRFSHMPVPQAMRVESRLNTVTEVAKVGVCGERLTSMGRNMILDGGGDQDPSSVCLAAMVNEFMEREAACIERVDSCSRPKEAMFNGFSDSVNSLQRLACSMDDLEIKILRDVQSLIDSSEEVHRCGCGRTDQTHMVMDALRRTGYNAAICKTKWDHSNGLPGGDYEYIDVLVTSDASAQPIRLLVDIEFQAQFEIARPSSEFSAVLQLVPPIFVGRSERLQQIVHLMAEATKQSLRIKGLHLPPWRKLNYMQAKWFSSYKRTSKDDGSSGCKQADVSLNNGGFTGIAVEEHNLDSRCANELTLLYHGLEPPNDGRKDAISPSNARDDLIIVTTTNWQPPPIEVRRRLNSRSQSNLAGLASMLLRSGLSTCSEVVAKAA